MDFKKFSQQVKAKFDQMKTKPLYVTATNKSDIWNLYLASFPEGSNNLYLERTEHDCNCCKQFIRTLGNVVAVADDGTLETIWDIPVDDEYSVVAKALSDYVKAQPVRDVFLHFEPTTGKEVTHQLKDDKVIDWNHFHAKLPQQVVKPKDTIPTALAETRANAEVLDRSLRELTLESAETVLEIIAQGSLYRGEEHKSTLNLFVGLKREFDALEGVLQANYAWVKSATLGYASKIRNTVIGSLLVDLSSGIDLESAVKSFEAKVAPSNYKRPKSLITKGMIQKAEAEVKKLGYEDSLARRYAVTADITINDVLFADRTAKSLMPSVFDEMIKETTDKKPKLDKVEGVSVEDFISNILPTADTVELLVENKHVSNLVSLIAPATEGTNMLKWDNNFSWSYNGELADSMKQHVKKAGGAVDGDLRCSLAWYSRNDLDLHLVEPSGNKISFSNTRSATGGFLDVDNTRGGTVDAPAVENITWARRSQLQEGAYKVFVRNYSGSNTNKAGFDFELEFCGTIYTIAYDKPVDCDVTCVEFNYTHAKGLEITNSLPLGSSSKEHWNIFTEKFHKVNIAMLSPNHWYSEQESKKATGNKHYFFMLEDCKNPEASRGFYNEFLDEALTHHRKVFEVLGSKMKAPYVDEQLSGLGFSSTQRNEAVFKVTGKFTRMIKVKF